MADGKTTGLVVIDAQVALFNEGPYQPEETIEAIRELLDRARAAGAPVLFIRHVDAGYPQMEPGHPDFEVHPRIAPLPDEPVFNKFACDAFYDTPLEAALRERGIDRIVIAGMQTEMCIDTASRSALHRNFNVTVAADGHTTFDNAQSGLTAPQIIAHENTTLSGIPHPTCRITVARAAEISFAD